MFLSQKSITTKNYQCADRSQKMKTHEKKYGRGYLTKINLNNFNENNFYSNFLSFRITSNLITVK